MSIVVKVHRFAAPTATGNTDITTTKLGGLTPVAALFEWTNATADGTITTHAHLGFGVTDGTNQWCIRSWEQNGQSVQNANRGGGTARCVEIQTGNGATALDSAASFVSFITNGIRLNFTTANTAYLVKVTFFAGTGMSAAAGVFGLGTAAGNTTLTGLSFQPVYLIGANNGLVSTTADSAFYHNSIGHAFDNGVTIEQGGIAHASDDNVSTMEGHGYVFDGALCGQVSPAGSLTYSLTVAAFTSDGFTINRSANPGSDSLFYLALAFNSEADAYVGVSDSPTATGDWTVTTGFTPGCAGILGGMMTAANTYSGAVTAGPHFSGTFDDTNGYTSSVAWEIGVATSNSQSISDDVHARLYEHTGATEEFLTNETGNPMSGTGIAISFSSVNGTGRKWVVWAIEEISASGVSVSLTGVQATGQVGSLAPTGGALISLTGVQATGQVGTLTIETASGVNVSLTGVQATGQVGNLIAAGGAIISITGVQATGQVGTLTIETAGGVNVSLTGVQATGQVGSLVATGGAIAIPGGVSALGVVGNLSTRLDTIVNLLGVSAEGLVGALDITGGANVSITGVQATGQVGTLTINTGLSEVEIPGHRILKVQHEDRTYLVVYEDRTYKVLH